MDTHAHVCIASKHQTARIWTRAASERALLPLTLLTLSALFTPETRASTVTLQGPSDFSGQTTTIDFDGLPSLTVVNTYYSTSDGVQFSRADGQPIPVVDWTAEGRTTVSPPNVIATISGSFVGGSASTFVDSINVNFANPTYQVGAYYGNVFVPGTTETLSLYNASNALVGSYSIAANDDVNVDNFIGLESSAPFVRATFSNSAAGFAIALDNVEFSPTPVPLPGTAPLLGLGVAVLGLITSRTHKRMRAAH